MLMYVCQTLKHGLVRMNVNVGVNVSVNDGYVADHCITW